MPSESQHLRAAAENKSLATDLLTSAYPGWAAVLAFYSALHFIESFLARNNVHAFSHQSRREYVAKIQQIRHLYEPYRRLETRSQDVRYRLGRLTATDAEQMIVVELRLIEESIRDLLANQS